MTEHNRLNVQHEMLKIKLGGLFLQPRAVQRALVPRNGSIPAVLDVGSGSGSWVLDMGEMFPHAEVVGLDLAPANLPREPTPNCRFECDDVNFGLSHYKNSFDVVHARCVDTGIADYPHFLKDVHQVLRPGGVFLSVSGSSKMLGKDFEPCVKGKVDPSVPSENNTATLLAGFHEAARARGAKTETFLYIRGWLEEMGKNAWSTVGETTFYVPVGPWQESMTDKDRHIATLMNHDIIRLLASTRPSLLSYGYPEQVVDNWIEKAEDELRHMRKKMYVRWICTWAVKVGTPGEDPEEHNLT